jgi:hypothetical protein
VIAGPNRRDARADLDDDARALVPEDHREQPFGIGARARELVGVTHARGLDLDQHLAGLRAFQIDLFDDERLTFRVRHGGTGSHAA